MKALKQNLIKRLGLFATSALTLCTSCTTEKEKAAIDNFMDMAQKNIADPHIGVRNGGNLVSNEENRLKAAEIYQETIRDLFNPSENGYARYTDFQKDSIGITIQLNEAVAHIYGSPIKDTHKAMLLSAAQMSAKYGEGNLIPVINSDGVATIKQKP